MAKLSISSLLETMGLRRPGPPTTKGKSKLSLDSVTTISPDEQKVLLQRVMIPAKKEPLETDGLIQAIQPISDDVQTRKFEAEQMKRLAPEIEQASAIMIPSILAPNDLQDNTLSFTTSCADLQSEEIIGKVNAFLTEYFSDNLELNKKLAEWLDTILYGAGSKPILILPELYLSNMIKANLFAAAEEFGGLEAYLLNHDLFSEGSGNVKPKFSECILDQKSKLKVYDNLKGANEALLAEADEKPDKTETKVTKELTAIEKILVKHIAANEDIVTIHEDPSVAGLSALKQKYNKKKRDQKVQNMFQQFEDVKFKPEELISFDDIGYNEEDELGHPMVLELPPESVIPIHTPGTPSDHIGYFIMLDKHGNPVNATKEPDKDKGSILKSSFHAMFQTKGAQNLSDMLVETTDYEGSVVKVYEQMLDSYIQKTLNAMTIENVDISKNQYIYKCMFRRFLEKKKTKLVFVPKEFLIYYRFAHNFDGTGKSKLEDIKFIMSLRITLMISKIMAAMDEAVVRQKLNLTFDEKISNPLEIMKKVKSRFIESKIVNFTYNPAQVVKSIADRGLTIIPNQIPGLEDFAIETEDNQSSKQRPDETLMEDLDRWFTLGLGPPPSAFNNLSEDEYSRSVATTNLFFSKQIRNYQDLVCGFTTQLVKTYIQFSKPLKEQLKELLKDKADDDKTSATTGDDGSGSVEETVLTKRLEEVIANLKAVLPPPNIAPDKAQFEEFKEYQDIIESMVDTMYSTELLEKDRDASEELTMIKAYVRSQMMREYLNTSGFGNSVALPEMQTMATTDLVKIQRFILNFRKRFEEMEKSLGGEGGGGSPY